MDLNYVLGTIVGLIVLSVLVYGLFCLKELHEIWKIEEEKHVKNKKDI